MSTPRAPHSLPVNPCRVLCVDDDPVMQRIFVAALVQSGFVIECVCSGQEALQSFTEAERGFDVLVIDHRMPGMNGRELVAALRDCGFGGPVVIISAALTSADLAPYHALGVTQFLAKPLTLEALRAAVGEAARLPS